MENSKPKIYPNEICNLGHQFPFQFEKGEFQMDVKNLTNLLSNYPDCTEIRIKNRHKLNNIVSVEEYWNLTTNTVELAFVQEDDDAK